MSCAKYVGRVGALAVALGVGVAVASTPGIAWADEPGASNNVDSPSGDDGAVAAEPTGGGGGGAAGDEHDTGAGQVTTTTTTTGSSTTTVIGGGNAPTVTFGSSGSIVTGGTSATRTAEPSATTTPTPLETAEPQAATPTPTVETPTPQTVTPTPTATPEAVVPEPQRGGNIGKLDVVEAPVALKQTTTPAPSFTKLAAPVGHDVVEVAVPPSPAVLDPGVTPNLAAARSFSALDEVQPVVPPAPAPSFVEAIVSTSANLISAGMTIGLKLIASYYGPGGQEDWPLLWGTLVLVRRQFNDAFGIENTPIVQGTTAITDPNADGYQLGTIAAKGGEGGGQTDAQGNLYVPAGDKLYVYSPDNELIRVDTLPFPVLDVAPGPNGDYIYVVDGDLIKHDPCDGCAPATPKKLVRGFDGTYRVDPTFHLDTYDYGPAAITPEGYRIATDDQGRLYVAQGMWTQHPVGTVLVYDTDGTLLTRFGDSVSANQNDPASYELGKFNNLNGIAVSPDGSTVYTVEATNSRVQVWTRQDDGSYLQTDSWGSTFATDPNHTGGGADGLNAPYDIGLDAAGDVYVISATDAKVVKYHPDGTKVTQMYVGSNRTPDAATPDSRAHGIAVTDGGDAFIPQTGLVMMHA